MVVASVKGVGLSGSRYEPSFQFWGTICVIYRINESTACLLKNK